MSMQPADDHTAIPRQFIAHEHIKNMLAGRWQPMFDNEGNRLNDIHGRTGAIGQSEDGLPIGVDLIEMQPGSSFALHTHSGQHILFVVEGEGVVSVNGRDHPLRVGDSVFVPANCPHGVGAGNTPGQPFQLLSFGYPHKNVDAHDRMQLHLEGNS